MNPSALSRKHTSASKFSAFTLVELIVVITILVILGTIAFISISGYSGSARDSTRVSDLANISKSLEISYIKTNSYPTPDNSFIATYSGSSVWIQGTIGEAVITQLNSGGGMKISKKPIDPLRITKEYTYSKLSFGKAFQLKTDYEGDTVSYQTLPFIIQTQAAAGNPTLSYIKGNYNGVVAKTQTGGVTYILAVPSIVSGTGAIGNILKIETNDLSGHLLVHGSSNTLGISYNPNKVVYSSGSLPSNNTERILFATGIANAYSGTILQTTKEIQPYITATQNNNTTELANLGGSMVSANLGGSAGISNTTTTVAFSATGGTITYTDSSGLNPRSSPEYPGGYKVHTFATIGTTSFQVLSGNGTVEYLIVAGGGGGGSTTVGGAGGGGGGGMLIGSGSLSTGSHSVVVGNGGNGGAAGGNNTGTIGGNSSFNGVIAVGGGGGGGGSVAGGNGGSGGGAGPYSGGGSASPVGQGYAGGTGDPLAAGGGGAGGAGQNASYSAYNGSGGPGLGSTISGTNLIYAAGGGGAYAAYTPGSGGSGGVGGAGAPSGGGSGGVGMTNRGGGGGGSTASNAGGKGGSGIAIVRYQLP